MKVGPGESNFIQGEDVMFYLQLDSHSKHICKPQTVLSVHICFRCSGFKDISLCGAHSKSKANTNT